MKIQFAMGWILLRGFTERQMHLFLGFELLSQCSKQLVFR